MLLHSQITTIPRPETPPVVLADLGVRVGTRVTRPHLDAATASGVVLDMHEDAIKVLMDYGAGDPDVDLPVGDNTLAIALRVIYHGNIVMWGPIHLPEFDYDSGQVELVARGPTLRMERAFVVDGDFLIDPGMTLDGRGYDLLLMHAQNRANQDALNWPSLGLVAGVNDATDNNILRKLQRGVKLFQALKDVSDLEVAPDWREVFNDDDPAAYARLDSYDKPLTDDLPDPTAIFHKGHGTDNAKTLQVRPQGDKTVNQFIATSKHGTKIRVNDSTRQRYGTYQDFQATGEEDLPPALAAFADANVAAYSRPVPDIDVAPADDTGENDTLRYGVDFVEGDHIEAIGKRGWCYHDILARLIHVELLQGESHVETSLDVIPTVAAMAEIGDG